MASIWIPRPYYYFNDILITVLVQEERNLEKKKLLDGRALFLIYEQLLASSIPTNGVLRQRTPYLYSRWLKGGFTTEEVDYAFQLFEQYELIKINDDRTITMLLYPSTPAQECPTIGDASVATATVPDDSNGHHHWTNYIIENVDSRFLPKNSPELAEFDIYFENFQVNDLLNEDIAKAIGFFNTDIKKEFEKNPKKQFKSRKGYFVKSFETNIEAIKSEKLKKKFQGEACEIASWKWVPNE